MWHSLCGIRTSVTSSLNSRCVAPTGSLHVSFRNPHLSLSSILPAHICTLQSLFLPNTHLSLLIFYRSVWYHIFPRGSTLATQIQLLVYSHWKIRAVNTHFFFQIKLWSEKWPHSAPQQTPMKPHWSALLSMSCHLVFQNWSCQVLDESKSKSTPTASRHSETKDNKKTGFETRSRELEANTVGFTKKVQIFHVLKNVENYNAIEKGINFFQSYFYFWCSNN